MPKGGARKAGTEFEKSLTDYHTVLQRQGLAMVHKVGPPFIVVGPGGKGALSVRLTGKAPSDFIGEAAFGDRATPVKFEAKTFHGKRWSFSEWWRDRKHQPADLEKWAAIGGLSFVLVRNISLATPTGLPSYPCWLLTDREILSLVSKNVKSLSVDELLEGYRLLPGIQWFDTAKKLMEA